MRQQQGAASARRCYTQTQVANHRSTDVHSRHAPMHKRGPEHNSIEHRPVPRPNRHLPALRPTKIIALAPTSSQHLVQLQLCDAPCSINGSPQAKMLPGPCRRPPVPPAGSANSQNTMLYKPQPCAMGNAYSKQPKHSHTSHRACQWHTAWHIHWPPPCPSRHASCLASKCTAVRDTTVCVNYRAWCLDAALIQERLAHWVISRHHQCC